MAAAAAILKMKLERLRMEKPRIIQGAYRQLKELECQADRIMDYESNSQSSSSLIEIDTLHDLRSKAIEMVLHCDFIIDTFISNNEQAQEKPEGVDLNKFREEIGSFSKEIEKICNKLWTGRSHSSRDGQPKRTRRGPPAVKESDVVGLEGEVEFLLNDAITTDGLSTICVVGMGGIGKTTLAFILYHHPAVAAHFEIRVWITLSTELYSHHILMELFAVLKKATGNEAMRIYPYKLQERIHQLLSGRKYFIVLDEAWNGISADGFLDAFPTGRSSALLVTSRNRKAIRKASCFHELKVLDAKKSWEMFSKKAFSGDGKCPKHLEEIGKQIVKKCDGLPLAIEEAAELLQQEKAEPEIWEKFLESMDLKRTFASLELSYNVLVSQCKPCFLNLAFFREGTTIKSDRLVQLWEAGELVPYLKCLIEQSLIQVKHRGGIGAKVQRLDINNNVRKLAISKATEEIRFEVLTKGRSYDRSLGKRRHLVIYCSREKFNYSLDQDQQLVSIFFHGGGDVASPSHWKNLKVLKMLDWEGFGLKSLPIGVETIVSLKYLGLRNNYIGELCPLLGQLKKLEVLDIEQNFLVEVPNIIWEMDNLRHLYMSDAICKNPLKIHVLKNLQTLTYISPNNWVCELSGLEMMTSLCKLGIEEVDGNTDVRKLFASLIELKKLNHLILKGFRFRRMPEIEGVLIEKGLKHLKLDGLLTRLPSYYYSSIISLSLVNSYLDEDPMQTLVYLYELRYLKLQNAYSGKQMVISIYALQSLRSLSIKELWHLRSVQVQKGAMRYLKKLEVISCPYLNTLPEEIGSMRFF